MSGALSRDRVAALLTFIPATLSLVIVVHHPVLRHADTQSSSALAAGIDRITLANAVFHGFVLFLLGVQALGLFSFAERLGLSRLWVRAGVALYGLATILLFIPGTLDGFVTPLLGTRCLGDPSLCAGTLMNWLTFEFAMIQAFTKVALAIQALGLLSWSVALALSPGRQRWTGIVGGVLAVAPLVMLGTMTHSIDPIRLAEIIAFEAVWAMGAAMMLWTNALPVAQSPHQLRRLALLLHSR